MSQAGTLSADQFGQPSQNTFFESFRVNQQELNETTAVKLGDGSVRTVIQIFNESGSDVFVGDAAVENDATNNKKGVTVQDGQHYTLNLSEFVPVFAIMAAGAGAGVKVTIIEAK